MGEWRGVPIRMPAGSNRFLVDEAMCATGESITCEGKETIPTIHSLCWHVCSSFLSVVFCSAGEAKCCVLCVNVPPPFRRFRTDGHIHKSAHAPTYPHTKSISSWQWQSRGKGEGGQERREPHDPPRCCTHAPSLSFSSSSCPACPFHLYTYIAFYC